MSLKPLGFRDSLNQSVSLKQNFQPLQSPPPLGKSLKPLGQSLQPLGEFLRLPLTQASFDDGEMTDSWFIPDSIKQRDIETWQQEHANNSPINLLSSSSPQPSVTNYRSPIPQAKFPQNELPFQNQPYLTNGSNSTKNSFDIKALGLSKPLAQESNILTSTQTALSQVIQNKSNLDHQIPLIGNGENSSFSDFFQPNRVATGNTTDSKLLDLPKINRYNEQRLGFNNQLVSPAFTESLEQTQASFQEIPNLGVVKANWQESALAETITTPSLPSLKSLVIQTDLETEKTLVQTKQNLAAIPPISTTNGEATPAKNLVNVHESSQLIQSKPETTNTSVTAEISGLPPETVAQPKTDLATTSTTNTTDAISGESFPNIPKSAHLIQPKIETTNTFVTTEISGLPPETVAQHKTDLAATSTTNITDAIPGESFPNPPESPNLIQAKKQTTDASVTGDISALPPETVAQPKTDLAATSTTNTTDAISGESFPNIPKSAHLIQPKTETTNTSVTTEISGLSPETVAQPQPDLAATSTTNITDAISGESFPNTLESPHLIQPKIETTNATVSGDISALPPETVAQPKTDLATTSTTNITDAISGESFPNIPKSAHLIQPKIETTNTFVTTEISGLPPETVAQHKTDLAATSTTNINDAIPGESFPNPPESPNLIQAKKQTTDAFVTGDISALPPETVAQPKTDLATTSTTNITDAISGESFPNIPKSAHLIQPKTETTNTSVTTEISGLPPETVAQPQPDLAATSTTNITDAISGESFPNTLESPHLIQPKIETTNATVSGDISALPPETVAQPKTDLATTSTTNTIDAISGESFPNIPKSAHLIQPKTETTNTSVTTEISGLPPETVAQPQPDLAATSTTNITDTISGESFPNTLESPHLIQPKIETVAQHKTDLAATSTTNITDAILGESFANPLESPNLIQAKKQTTDASVTGDISALPPEIVAQHKTDLAATSTTNITDAILGESFANPLESPNLIQAKKQTTDASVTGDISALPPEIVAQPKTDLAATSTTNTSDAISGESLVNVPVSPQLIQPKPETTDTSVTTETSALPPKTVVQPQLDLAATSTTNTSDAIPGESFANTLESPHLIQPKPETNNASVTADISALPPEIVAQPKTDLAATSTTNTSDAISGKSFANTLESPHIIQPKPETTDTSVTTEISALPPKTVVQPQLDLAATSTTNTSDTIPGESFANTLESPHLIQPKPETTDTSVTADISPLPLKTVAQPQLDLAVTSTTTTTDLLEQKSTLISPKLETSNAVKAPSSATNILETSSKTSTPALPNIIQPRLDKQILNHIKPLGISKPLSQQSDFVTSGMVDDFIDKSTSSQNPLPLDSNLPQEIGNIPDSGSNIPESKSNSANEIKDDLTSVKPLGFSQTLNSTNNLILPKLDLSGTNGEKPKTIGFDDIPDDVQKPLSNTITNIDSSIPTSWSSISELLGKSSKTENNTVPEENESTHLSSPSYTLFSPFSSHSSHSETADTDSSNSNGEVSQELTKESFPKNNSSDNEQLDILAQKVYTLMRQSLEVTQERHGREIVGNPIWLSNITSIYGTATTNSDVISPLDTQLQELTQKVSLLIQKRFEIERERRGHYYAGRLPC